MKTIKYITFLTTILIAFTACSDDDSATDTPDDPNTNTLELVATDLEETIQENPEEGFILGRIEVNESDGTTYTVSDSDPAGAVFVNNLGQVVVSDPAAFDFETRTEITAEVTVRNGEAETMATVAILITDADDLRTLLTTSRDEYESANGSWIEVTEDEYNLLAERVLNTQRIGVPEAAFNPNQNILQTAGDITIANSMDTPMPQGSYLYAFKYYSTSGTNNNSEGQMRPKVSEETATSGYIGRGPLPVHGPGFRYFIKAEMVATESETAYLGLYSPYSMGWLENNASEMYFRFGNGSNLTNGTNGVQVLFQGLVTDVKQWE